MLGAVFWEKGSKAHWCLLCPWALVHVSQWVTCAPPGATLPMVPLVSLVHLGGASGPHLLFHCGASIPPMVLYDGTDGALYCLWLPSPRCWFSKQDMMHAATRFALFDHIQSRCHFWARPPYFGHPPHNHQPVHRWWSTKKLWPLLLAPVLVQCKFALTKYNNSCFTVSYDLWSC